MWAIQKREVYEEGIASCAYLSIKKLTSDTFFTSVNPKCPNYYSDVLKTNVSLVNVGLMSQYVSVSESELSDWWIQMSRKTIGCIKFM